MVSNETELQNALADARFGESVVIALDKDITITSGSLIILACTNITLTSNKASGFYKLIGATTGAILQVDSGGVLILDGIIVTHTNGARSSGVLNAGTLIMRAGEVSDNYVGIGGGGSSGFFSSFEHSYGGGVMNAGVFEMYGGKISGNTARAMGNGGGVYNGGGSTFMMYGGEISGNTAARGGGVCNGGTFVMFGGEILGNTAEDGGGVCNWGNFTMVGGSITRNTADYGGGVYNSNPVRGGVYFFDRQDGKILGNIAAYGDNDVKDMSHDTEEGSSGGTDTAQSLLIVSGLMFIVMLTVIVAVVVAVIVVVVIVLLSKSKKQLEPTEKT
ncbi:MAG: hypothetical protein LBI79_07985 [Nitrososphaerota archaeon]|nr:hypothetical protein [Nitrososphaerota archaeon]